MLEENNPPHDFRQNLVEWIIYLSINSPLLDAVDKSIAGRSCNDDLLECLKVANACVASILRKRLTMLEVYQLIRIIGNRYRFLDEDEIAIRQISVNHYTINSNERFVSREIMKCDVLVNKDLAVFYMDTLLLFLY